MVTIAQFITSVVIGIVQGISEWLPISSKTQILIVSQYMLHISTADAYSFGLFMEIGTVIAAIIYFRKELYKLLKVLFLVSKEHEDRMMFTYVVIATFMTGLIGVPIYFVSDKLANLGGSLGIIMILLGLVLIGDGVLIKHARSKQSKFGGNTRRFKDMSIKDYIIIGITQGLAALPGVSRSGITTSTMILMKIEPDEAFRLSFIVGIFASAAAFLLTLIVSKVNIAAAVAGIGITGILIAIVVAAIISMFLIDFLIKVAGKSKIVYLVVALGLIAIASGCMYLVFGIAA